MKVYISVDIEGVAGIAAAAEASMDAPAEYEPFRRQMAAEAMAACDGAFAAGAKEILVKDAHGTGRNLTLSDLAAPEGGTVQLIRGWSGHPFGMVQELDESFAAAVFIGFHCAAGQAGNPLAHTLNGRLFSRVELNGALASELRLHAYAAALVKVPVIFVSGDRVVCDEAQTLVPGVATVSTLEGLGPSVRSTTPQDAVRRIRQGVEAAVHNRATEPLPLPNAFTLIVRFRHAADAYARSFYPGVSQVGDCDLEMRTGEILQILTFLRFASHYR